MLAIDLVPTLREGRPSRLRRWLARQWPKRYLRVLLAGIALSILALILLRSTRDEYLIPLVALVAGAVVPLSFVTYCWKRAGAAAIPPMTLGHAFVAGATLSPLIAISLETLLAITTTSRFGYLLLVVGAEEVAKALMIVWFLRNQRLRRGIDGLVLGVAIGMGFAALETAGYGISAYIQAYTHDQLRQLSEAFSHGVVVWSCSAQCMHGSFAVAAAAMAWELTARLVTQVFGHGIYTGIVCAAIWRDRRGKTLRITWGVVLAFTLSILLHVVWDSDFNTVGFSSVGLNWVFAGVAGIFLFRFFLRESVERAKLLPDAPAPPLAIALWHYVRHPFARPLSPIASPDAFATETALVVDTAAGCGPVPLRADASEPTAACSRRRLRSAKLQRWPVGQKTHRASVAQTCQNLKLRASSGSDPPCTVR